MITKRRLRLKVPSRNTPFSEPSGNQRFMIQEYWVDFLGGLLPGVLFSVVLLVIIIPPALLLLNALSGRVELGILNFVEVLIKSTQGTPSMIWIAVAIVIVALSYILGHIFYRQDPKVPNQISFGRLEGALAQKKGVDKCTKEILMQEFGCPSKEKCEFPYENFDKYLEHRGLTHLVPLASCWCQSNHRTKNYINILKVRLRFHFPNHCSAVIKNEAHVRLATSTWYVGKTIDKCGYLAYMVLSLAFGVNIFSTISSLTLLEISQIGFIEITVFLSPHISTIFPIALGAYLGRYLKHHVEDFIHYQRQREIVHVLEIAWTAFRESPELLKPPFDDFEQKGTS